jgi:hypothetical protein
MNGTNDQRGTRKFTGTPSDLAQQFREWQRLRKQVRDLEQSTKRYGQPSEPCDDANQSRHQK